MSKVVKKVNFDQQRLIQRGILVVMLMLVVAPTFAQEGASGIMAAANKIKQYWEPIKILIQAIGAVVGLIGAIRIYNKWTNGDQDINKELMGWGGACVFLIIAPSFVGSFFGM